MICPACDTEYLFGKNEHRKSLVCSCGLMMMNSLIKNEKTYQLKGSLDKYRQMQKEALDYTKPHS
jgi:hypothetical protein